MLQVKVFNPTGVTLPEQATPFSAAKDIRANLHGIDKIKGEGASLVWRDSSSVTGHAVNANHGDYKKACVLLKPHGRALIPSGLMIELPEGHSMDVRPRSGLALKYGITVLNTPGLVDEDYRGDVGVIVINHDSHDVIIVDGERLAQIKINKDYPFEWIPVEHKSQLSDTARGDGGFNSTGTK